MTCLKTMMTGLTLTLAMSGCLDPNDGKTTGTVPDSIGADVGADATGAEVVVADTVVADTTGNQCLDRLCDDGNPCTENQCDPASGCFFAPIDDGRPCGECANCEAGVCEPVTLPPIEAPDCDVSSDCDDGDPCTADACDCGPATTCSGFFTCTCNHVPIPGCGLPTAACDDVGAVGPVAATATPPGSFMKVRGQAVMHNDAVCDQNISECTDCFGSLVFTESGHHVVLQPEFQTFGPEGGWGCRQEACTPDTVCTPMGFEAFYYAWGTAQEHLGPDPSISEVRLVVEGYCLATDASSFAGEYVGTLSHDYGMDWPVTLSVDGSPSAGWSVSLSALDCDQCPDGGVAAQVATKVKVEAGRLYFEAQVPNGAGIEVSLFTVDVDQNRILGWFESDYGQGFPGSDAEGGGAAVAIPGGSVQVERSF